jgi:hypothetical protein
MYRFAFLVSIACVASLVACGSMESIGQQGEALVVSCSDLWDCPLSPSECIKSTCVNNQCALIPLPVNYPCNSGVGVCLVDQTCRLPVGNSKDEIPLPAVPECSNDTDCTQNQCAPAICEHKHCLYRQHSGDACSYGTCNEGLCCLPPAGMCEPPLPTLRNCTENRECDDSDSCTSDFCNNGWCAHMNYADNVTCSMHSGSPLAAMAGGYGQCSNGACCLP